MNQIGHGVKELFDKDLRGIHIKKFNFGANDLDETDCESIIKAMEKNKGLEVECID